MMEEILFDYISKYMPLLEEEKEAIIGLDVFKFYKKGAVLLREGDYSADGYFVLKGCIRSYYLIDGEERTTAIYTESHSFSPLSITSGKPSAHYVACVEDSMLIVANVSMEQKMFERFPRIESLCRILSEEMLTSNQASFDDFKLSTPEQRYLNVLETRPDLLQRVPQYQLASYLGITPQSLSRLRKRIVQGASDQSRVG